ncbi:MAG TPA: peptidoglycan-binding protein LysM, partial [Alphaproteobacteria bacterium]|nr:peptidoglycan-binding protein LysM [Alphaproteobacteria bacterium]
MGIFSFVKSVGESLFGKAEAAAKPVTASMTATPVAAPAAPPAAAIKEHIVNLGLPMPELDVKVEGERVILTGTAPTDEVREKVILAAGNTLGVAEVQDEITTPEPAVPSVFYTVQKGDTLWEIAEAQYGKGHGGKYPMIFEANKPM